MALIKPSDSVSSAGSMVQGSYTVRPLLQMPSPMVRIPQGRALPTGCPCHNVRTHDMGLHNTHVPGCPCATRAQSIPSTLAPSLHDQLSIFNFSCAHCHNHGPSAMLICPVLVTVPLYVSTITNDPHVLDAGHACSSIQRVCRNGAQVQIYDQYPFMQPSLQHAPSDYSGSDAL